MSYPRAERTSSRHLERHSRFPKSTTSAFTTVAAGCVPKIVFFADLDSGGYSWLRDENGHNVLAKDTRS